MTEQPHIEWEMLERYDSAGDGYVFFHTARGTSEDGRTWSGSATMCMGELEEITDIEEADQSLNHCHHV